MITMMETEEESNQEDPTTKLIKGKDSDETRENEALGWFRHSFMQNKDAEEENHAEIKDKVNHGYS